MPSVNKTILSPLCILATLSKARWLYVWDVLSRSVVSDSLQLHELYLARFLCPWGFSRQKYWSGLACPSPGDLPNPGIESRSPVLQVDSLPSEPPGNPKITVEGSLSLLKVIFLTKKSNQSLMYCRRILYQLSNEGSPIEALLCACIGFFSRLSILFQWFICLFYANIILF